MPDLTFALVDEASIDAIPAPARPGTRCQTCDYWERLEGSREGQDTPARRDAKRAALLAGARLAGSYGMLATARDGTTVGYAQFGPLSAYPRAQLIRDRYPELPESPAPWVITCLQVLADAPDRLDIGQALAEAVCAELDLRGVIAVEVYPERAADPWLPPGGPASVYESSGFAQAAGDDRYPVYRRDLARRWAGATCLPKLARRMKARSGRYPCPRGRARRTSSDCHPSPIGPTRSGTTDR